MTEALAHAHGGVWPYSWAVAHVATRLRYAEGDGRPARLLRYCIVKALRDTLLPAEDSATLSSGSSSHSAS